VTTTAAYSIVKLPPSALMARNAWSAMVIDRDRSAHVGALAIIESHFGVPPIRPDHRGPNYVIVTGDRQGSVGLVDVVPGSTPAVEKWRPLGRFPPLAYHQA
jgi:hypothetical protein